MPGLSIDHPITLISQPTATKCWWASACMILNKEIPKEGDWVGPSGGLVVKDAAKMAAFAKASGLVITDQSLSITTDLLSKRLAKAALMICAGKAPKDGVIGSHSVVICGIDGEKFHVYDPEPVGKGSAGWIDMTKWNDTFPFNAFWIFQKA